MKKWLLVTAILATVILATGCGQDKTVPSAAKTEVFALNESGPATDYVEVQDVSDREDFLYVMVYIKSLPGEFTSMEDALPLAAKYSMTIAEATVEILNGYNINKDVAVWTQLPLEEGGVKVLGHVEYDGKSYIDFERHQP